MPYLKRDNAETYYETAGEGPPLLLIAGIASDVASWAPVVPLLEPHFRLIMFDNRGAGRTRHNGPIDPGDWVDDAIAVLDHLEAGKVNVVGHSLGGMIGIRVALAAPDRVNRLVAAATTANPQPKASALMREMAAFYEGGMNAETWFRLLFQWLFAPPFFDDPQRVAEAGQLSAGYAYCQSPADFRRQVDAVERMGSIDPAMAAIPVTLITGSEDVLIPPASTRLSFAADGMVSEIVINGAGHSLHWDKPDAFADAVRQSLNE